MSDEDKTAPKALQASAAMKQSGMLGRSDSGFSRFSDEHGWIRTKGLARSLKQVCEGCCVWSCRPLLLRTQRQPQDEEGKAAKDLQGPQQSSSEAERRAVLERLQGEDNPLAAGFKVSPDISLHLSHSGLQSARCR